MQLVELAREYELLGPLPEPQMAAPLPVPPPPTRKPAKDGLKGLL